MADGYRPSVETQDVVPAQETQAITADRRSVLALTGVGLAGALLGLGRSTAQATSALGVVGPAEAQPGPAAAPAPWWPSRFGKDDETGATNLITPQKILEALSLVKTGKVYEMAHLYESTMPKFGERAFVMRIPGGPTGGPVGANNVIWNDEFIATEIGQVGTQFDGLGHIGAALKGQDRAEMRFYNGFSAAEVNGSYGLKKLGIEHVKPIITVGHMFDLAGLKGRSLNAGEEITPADLEAAAARQKFDPKGIKPGDAVFLHTGWGALWNKDNPAYIKGEPGIGLAGAKWFIDKQVCLVGADSWAIEVVPNPDATAAFPVHQELLAKNGIHIHECLITADLAADSVSTFAYIMLPLLIKGATGSPGRPVALI
jgi:kynurenine formamidase